MSFKISMVNMTNNRIKNIKLERKFEVAVLGNGSWATALIKILTENKKNVKWYVRKNDDAILIKKNGRNPKYLTSCKLNINRLKIESNINKIVDIADVIIVAIPSIYVFKELTKIKVDTTKKIFISATKGILPEKMQVLGEFLHNHFKISLNQIGIISGPCHAEEIAMERLSYLTLSCLDDMTLKVISNLLKCKYIRVTISNDINGTQYAAMLKNCYAIAAGIAYGLGYGDNFMSVLMSNSVREMKKFIKEISNVSRDINNSVYLGDMLVTSYSSFSRNRRLGVMLGKGYNIKNALLEINMTTEGYYGSKSAFQINQNHKCITPILDSVYSIMYQNIDAKKVFKKLESKLD